MAPSKQLEKPQAPSPIQDCIVVNTSRPRTLPSGEDRDNHAQNTPNISHSGSRRVGTKTANLAGDAKSSLDDAPAPGQARHEPQSQPSSCKSQHPHVPSETTRDMPDAPQPASGSAARDAKRGPTDSPNANTKRQKRSKKISTMPKDSSRTPLPRSGPLVIQIRPAGDSSRATAAIPNPSVDSTVLSAGQSTREDSVSQSSSEIITRRQAEEQLNLRQSSWTRAEARALTEARAQVRAEARDEFVSTFERFNHVQELQTEAQLQSHERLEYQVEEQRLAIIRLQTSFESARAEMTETGASQRTKIAQLEQAVDDANKRLDERDHALQQAQDRIKEQAAQLSVLDERLDGREFILEQAQNTKKEQVAKISALVRTLKKQTDAWSTQWATVIQQTRSRDSEQKARISELENNHRMDKHTRDEKEQQQQKELERVLRLLRDAEATRQDLEASLKKSQDIAESQEKRMKEVSGSIRAFMAANMDEPDEE